MKTPTFFFLPHTADVYYEVVADNFSDLVRYSVLGMLDVITGGSAGKIRPKDVVKTFEMDRSSPDEFFVYLLSDILSDMDINEVVYYDVDVEEAEYSNERYRARVVLYGNHDRPKDNVKGVTFHGFKFFRDDRGLLHVRILLDV